MVSSTIKLLILHIIFIDTILTNNSKKILNVSIQESLKCFQLFMMIQICSSKNSLF